MDDFISYDEKQGVLIGKETQKRLSTGDKVRVRVTAVSFGRGSMTGKIGVTARQPFLGKLEWIKQAVRKSTEGKTETEEKEEAS